MAADQSGEGSGPAPEADVEDMLRDAGVEIGPKPERVSEEYADARIREKVDQFEREKQRRGIASINTVLKEHNVPPSVRLHLVTAVAHLSRISESTLDERVERSGGER